MLFSLLSTVYRWIKDYQKADNVIPPSPHATLPSVVSTVAEVTNSYQRSTACMMNWRRNWTRACMTSDKRRGVTCRCCCCCCMLRRHASYIHCTSLHGLNWNSLRRLLKSSNEPSVTCACSSVTHSDYLKSCRFYMQLRSSALQAMPLSQWEGGDAPPSWNPKYATVYVPQPWRKTDPIGLYAWNQDRACDCAGSEQSKYNSVKYIYYWNINISFVKLIRRRLFSC